MTSPGVRTRISPRRRRLSCSFGALGALGCRNPACQRAWLAAAQPGSHGGWINAHGGPSCVPLIVATLCSSDVSSPDARTHAGLALLQAGRRATCVAEGTIPADEADDLFISVGVFIHWLAEDDKKMTADDELQLLLKRAGLR